MLDTPAHITIKEASHLLQTSASHARVLFARGELSGVMVLDKVGFRHGKKILVTQASVDRLLAARQKPVKTISASGTPHACRFCQKAFRNDAARKLHEQEIHARGET